MINLGEISTFIACCNLSDLLTEPRYSVNFSGQYHPVQKIIDIFTIILNKNRVSFSVPQSTLVFWFNKTLIPIKMLSASASGYADKRVHPYYPTLMGAGCWVHSGSLSVQSPSLPRFLTKWLLFLESFRIVQPLRQLKCFREHPGLLWGSSRSKINRSPT